MNHVSKNQCTSHVSLFIQNKMIKSAHSKNACVHNEPLNEHSVHMKLNCLLKKIIYLKF